MYASFGVVFGMDILGMGCIFKEKFWNLGLSFARNSGNAQVWDDQKFFCCFIVETLVRNHMPILGFGLKIPPKFWNWVFAVCRNSWSAPI